MRTFKEKCADVVRRWVEVIVNPYEHWLGYNLFGRLFVGLIVAALYVAFKLVCAIMYTVSVVIAFVLAHVLWAICGAFFFIILLSRSGEKERAEAKAEWLTLYRNIDSPAIVDSLNNHHF